ncbi:hypothetical protein [Microbacterium marinilacus]|uniref:Uncharacterized protein n=1 Tax=Microbacterium marinilacus TaxID=415209 RepID=A0ABP7B695_9MICO|nr:hypothetical protein [Microbacterium marinilacus]MBY0687520.1 hypothetical protein [Microbacterium marinilacus]
MYILLALIAAVAIGVGVHFALPRRALRGITLAPSLAGGTAAIVYAVCTWTGLGEASPWTWLASLAAASLVSWAGADAISRVRAARDAAQARRLGLA